MNILIVDDDPNIRETLGQILKVKGFEVEEAGTGSEAIASCGAKFFNLVLLDMRLPDISGLEVLKRVLALNKDIIVIMMTGYASLDSSIEAMNNGAYSYIIKPINIDAMLVLIENGFEKQRMSLDNKRMVETLRASEQKFKTVFNEAIDGMLIASAESQEFLEANDSICRMLGYAQEEMKHLKVEDIHSKEDLPSVQEIFDRQLRGEIAIAKDVRVKRKNENIFYADISSSVVDLFGRKCLLGIFRDVSDFKRAEDALKEAEKYNRELIESANSIVIRWKPEGPIEFINNFGLKIFGYTKEELIGTNVAVLVPKVESTGRDLSDLVSNIAAYPERYSLVENENVNKNGERFWVVWTNKALTDEQGNIKEILTIGNDVTERKQIEDELLNSKKQLWELFNNMNSCVAVYAAKNNGEDFIIVNMNKAGEISSKISRKEIIGKSVLQVFPGVKELGLFDVFQKVWKAGKPQHYPLSLYKDERLSLWVENYVFKLPSGEIVAIYNDITERKKAGEELAESEKKFRAIFDRSTDGMVLTDIENKKFVDANNNMCRMLGYSLEEFKMLGVTDIHPKEALPFVLEQIEKQVHDMSTPAEDLPMLRKDGTIFYANVLGTKMKLMGREYMVGVFRDSTERKKMEESLRKSEESYRSIVDNIGIGIALVSPEMEILSLNNQMRKWNPHMNLKDKHICYRTFNNPPKEEVCSYCPTIKTLEDGSVHESVTETPMNGKIFNYRIISSPIKDKTGKVIAAIEMVEDITDRKKAEDQLQQSIKDLKAFHEATLDRENKMIELKAEVNKLAKELGRPAPHDLSFLEGN